MTSFSWNLVHGSKKTFVLFKEIELLFNHNDIGIYIAFLQAFFTKLEFFLDKIFLIAFSLAIFFLEFPALGNLTKVHIHQANQVSLKYVKKRSIFGLHFFDQNYKSWIKLFLC